MWQDLKPKIMYGAYAVFNLYIIISFIVGTPLKDEFLFLFIADIIISLPFLICLIYMLYEKLFKFKKAKCRKPQ